jgi:hypothetical protein
MDDDPAAQRLPEPSVLAAGKRFHHEVQAAYVAGLLGVQLSEVREQTIVRPGGERQRADILLLVTTEPERMQFVVEIKSTIWQGRTETNWRRGYLVHFRRVLEAGLASRQAWVTIARDGLHALHRRMQYRQWQDEAYAAIHGGLWRAPYQPRSALGLAAILGYRAART